MVDKKIKVLGFAGSLRKGSYNRALLQAASELMPENAELEIYDLNDIPPFNQDLENDMPLNVKEFKEKIRKADAILISTPEYNYSFSGVLKNAIDWASRPYQDNSLRGKPVAIMSASVGMFGGVRAQHHLRQVLVGLNMYPLNKPEVMVPYADEKFDEKGKLIDQETREIIQKFLEAFIKWTIKIIDNECIL